ncbi:helix-turn-helix domain-containing protein [Micromonospora sp. NPDC000089]|uniref:helix-turn-helix domain-containing protein n=1 Tax=unclassified Micromonospora TaxID=2617518 RepID=UPI0036A43DCC
MTHANCPRCGGRLARDNDSGRCAPCQAAERDRLSAPPAVPASFWEHEPVRQALASRHLGRVIRAYRSHPYHGRVGLPQVVVAGWLGITQAQLSRVENGPPVVHLDRLIHWAQVLAVPGEHLWFALPGAGKRTSTARIRAKRSAQHSNAAKNAGGTATDGSPSVTAEAEPAALVLARLEVLRQGLTESVSGGGSTASAYLDDWEQVVLDHGRATRHRPAQEHFRELATDFTDIQRLFSERLPSNSLRRLTRATAQMAGLMFLTLIKMGEPGYAGHWIRTARIAADEAADPATQCWVRGQEAYVHYYRGQLTTALVVAEEAQAVGRFVSCAGEPLAAALQARAEARMGHTEAARSALGRAEVALSALDADHTVASAFGYDEAQLRFHEGNAYTHLGHWSAARSAQERALALYPARDFLDRALIRLDQAMSLAREGDVNTAAVTSCDTLLSLSPTQRTGLLRTRAWEVYQSFPAPGRGLGAAREMYEILADTSAGARG